MSTPSGQQEPSDPSAAPAARTCGPGDLTAEVIETGSQVPGDELFRLTFTATGDPCELGGYPSGITFLDAAGTKLTVKVTESGGDPARPVVVSKDHAVESIIVNKGQRHEITPAKVQFSFDSKTEPTFELAWPAPIGAEVTVTPVNNQAG